MNITIIRAVSLALFGGVAAFLAFGPGAGHGVRLLALLLGWASCLHFGAGVDGLKRSVIHSLAGAILSLAAVLFAAQYSASGKAIEFPLWVAIGVAVTLGIVALAARVSAFADTAGLLIGYAAIAGTAQSVALDMFLAPSPENPALGVLLSLVIGAVFAYGAEALEQALATRIGRQFQEKAPASG